MRKKQENPTEKELEVLSLLGLGFSNKEIAENMCITEHTVKAHLTNIYKKLGVKNRTTAALFARDFYSSSKLKTAIKAS